jgi:hypothetical protein
VPSAINVRFGSKADIRSAIDHVRFTPNSDRKSGFPQTVMSALPPKADGSEKQMSALCVGLDFVGV